MKLNSDEPIRTIIVDDNPMTRALLKIILRGEQFSLVGEATNGQDGTNLALELQPDLILLDICMPNGSGIDILKAIRERLPNACILMVTGEDDAQTQEVAAKCGANGYIVKPFNTQSLLGVLGNIEGGFTFQEGKKFQAWKEITQ